MTQNYFKSYDDIASLIADASAQGVLEQNTKIIDDGLSMGMGKGWMCADRRHVETSQQAISELSKPLFEAGVQRLERLRALIDVPAPASIKRKVRRGDHGDELDMSRVWQGDLDNAWTRAKRERSLAASRVLIGVFIGAYSGVEAETIAWRGVAGLALADALEQSGYTVYVRAIRRAKFCLRSGARAGRHDVDITIKPEGVPLDVHKAASLIASPLLFRGVLLRHACVVATERLDDGVTNTDYEHADLRDAQGYDHTCMASQEVQDARSAQAWIDKQISTLNELNRDAHFT